MRLYREYLKELKLFTKFDPVASSVIKFSFRTEFEIESKKNENKLSNLIQTKAKELDYIKRANQGDLNALKRHIPNLLEDIMKKQLMLIKDLNNDILYGSIKSKKRKIKVRKLELPFMKYINPDAEIFKKHPCLPCSESSPNIFSKDAKERFGVDKFEIFVKEI